MIKSTSSRKTAGNSTAGLGCLVLFGLPFLIGGLVVTVLVSCSNFQSLWARWWVETPCTVESSDLESHMGDDSATWKAAAKYSWAWNGAVYRSDRVVFAGGSDNIGDFQKRAARALKAAVGKTDGFRCWVNPSRPSEAVLYRDVRWEIALFHLPFIALFPTVGGALMIGAVATRRRCRQDDLAEAQNPGEPRRGRSDWANDCVEDRGLRRSPVVRAVLIWWTLCAVLTAASLFLTDTWESGRKITAAAACLGTCVLLICTLRAFRSIRRFGRLVFIPDALPLIPGGKLSGMIALPSPLRFPASVTARIRVMGKKGENAKELAKTDAVVDVHPSGIGVEAELPSAPGSSPHSLSRDIEWILVIKAPKDAVRATFDLPVFDETAREIPAELPS